MKIGGTKSILITAEILEFLAGGAIAQELTSAAQKWAEELANDTLKSAFNNRKHYVGNNIEFSVTVSIGTPEEKEQ